MNKQARQNFAIHVGGFIGPFVGQSLAVILPEFSQTFGISLQLAAFTITAYMLPFASTMLISNRLVRNLSPSKVVILAFIITLIGALLLFLAPTWWLFLIVFIIMAIANAFTTPVLQVLIKRITPDHLLGSQLGTYTAAQSLGVFTAPLVAGAAATVNWRFTYLVVILACLFVLIVGLPHTEAQKPGKVGTSQKIDWITTIGHMFTYLIIGIGVVGMPFAVSLFAGEKFDIDSLGRGLVVMCGGLAAFFFSRPIGSASDRIGAVRTMALGLGSAVLGLLLLPLVPQVALVGVSWGLTLVGVQGAQIVINVMVLRSPGGTDLLSAVLAFRFFGLALAPVLMLPVYNRSHSGVFWLAAAVMFIALGIELVLARRRIRD